jgi:hypothetical protein
VILFSKNDRFMKLFIEGGWVMGGAGGRGKGGSLFQKNDFSERFIKKGRFLFEWNSNGENTLIYLPVNSIHI